MASFFFVLVLVLLCVSLCICSQLEDPLLAFRESANALNIDYRRNGNRARATRAQNTDSCVAYCSLEFTACTMIDYPVFPIGLNLSITEPIAAASIKQTDNPFIPAACQSALAQLTCGRIYPSCRDTGSGIAPMRPCRSICLNARANCGALLDLSPDQDAVNCTAVDNGVPRYGEDGVDDCYVTHPQSDATRAACNAGPVINVTDVMMYTELSQDQVQALADLWESTSGPQWKSKKNWGIGDPCTWQGVHCIDNDTIVDTLVLSDFNLRGSIPSSLSILSQLTKLDLSRNVLSGTIPSSLGSLSHLTDLQLEENVLTGSIPDSFANLNNLVYLNLGAADLVPNLLSRLGYKPTYTNKLSGTVSDAVVAGWPKLQKLNLANNNFYGTLPASIGNLVDLTIVDISSNKFTGLGFSFSQLTKLEELDVSDNYLSGRLPDVSPCTSLRLLYVYLNQFEGAIPDSYATLTNLMEMGLMYCPLTSGLEKLFGLTKLTGLGLSYTGFTGQPYEKICNLKNLQVFGGYGVQFTGSIPVCLGDMPNLLTLDFGLQNLNGTVPKELGKLDKLVFLSLASNYQLTGQLPPELGGMKSLSSLYISDLPYIKSVFPPEWAGMESLAIASITRAGIYGSIPAELCGLSSLTQLFLSSNNLTGTLPECLSTLSKLTDMDISGNKISGTIPAKFGDLKNLITLRANDNQLEGTVPILSTLSNLQLIDLSSNGLEQDIGDLMAAVRISGLTTLDVANNKINGEVNIYQVYDITTGPIFLKMVDLNLGHNNIQGELGSILGGLTSLSTVDVSYNNFHGAVTSLPRTAKVMIADGNPNMTDPTGKVPGYLQVTDSYIKDPKTGSYSCPVLTGQEGTSTILVQIDWSYYNYSVCMCEPGYFGIRNQCKKCLEHGDCESDPSHESMIISPGYAPTPNEDEVQMLIPCPQDTFTENPCNPKGKTPFECKEGHTGRLCSDCIKGYRRDGFRCTKCNEATKVTTILFAVVAVIILYAYLLWPRAQTVESGLLKNFLFFTQATSFVLESTSKWATPIPIVKKIFTGTNFNIGFLGFGCVADETFTATDEYLVTMLLPIIFLGITAGVYVGIFTFKLLVHKDMWDISLWKHRCYFAFFFVINALYFPLVTKIFSAFNCNEDPVTKKEYMDSRPYIECSADNHQYKGILAICIIFLIPYVIGIPGLFYGLMRHFIKYPDRNRVKGTIMTSFFMNCYREDLYWWEFVIFARRLVFSMFISLIPISSPFLSLAIFLIIVASILVNSWKVPFNMKITNILDLVGFGVILMTFLSGVLFSSPQYQAYSDPLAIVIFILNMIMITAYLAAYLAVVLRHKLFVEEKKGFLGKLWGLLDTQTQLSTIRHSTSSSTVSSGSGGSEKSGGSSDLGSSGDVLNSSVGSGGEMSMSVELKSSTAELISSTNDGNDGNNNS